MDGLWADGMEAPTKLTAVSSRSECCFVLRARRDPRIRTKFDNPLMPLSFSVSGSAQAIDTGTSLIYVPPTIASAFYGLIPGSKRASQYGSGERPLLPAMC